MDLNNLKLEINLKDFQKKIYGFFEGKSRWILSFIFLLAVAYCGYLLYINVYHPDWSEAKKTEYLNSKGKEVIFDEKRFNALVAGEEERKEKHKKTVENIPDLFDLK